MATCPKCRTQYPNDAKVCRTDGERLLPDEAFSSSDADLAPGQMVGEYQVEKKIGEGGFGTVYRAIQPLIGKLAAIKLLNREFSSNPQMVSRFIAEARSVNQIRHRNIIDIFSFGIFEDGRQYFVMEYLDGMPFDVYLRNKGRLGPEEAIPILRQVAKALDAAHAGGVVHRDLKPENVFISFDDGVPFPKLLDFGIAKLLDDSQRTGHRTRTGTPIGTPYYMAPEQCLGKNVDHRADIYSFGIMCHEVLTGALPFMADETMSILFKHVNDAPPAMSSAFPELKKELDEPVLRMLEKAPDKRPSTVIEAVEALARAARQAGYEVQLETRRATPPAHTPLSGQEIATARTIATDGSSEPVRSRPGSATAGAVASDTLEVRKKPSSALWLGLGGAALVAVLVAVVLGSGVLRGPAKVTASADPIPAVPVTVSTPVLGSSAAIDPPPVSSEVVLTVAGQPRDLGIYRGEDRIGTGLEPIRLPRGDKAMELTFKAPGYQSKTVSIVPEKDAIVSIDLLKQQQKGKGKPTGKSEIESPF